MTRQFVTVLGRPIDLISSAELLRCIDDWAVSRQSRCVCFCNAHSLVTALDDPAMARALDDADANAPDGWPVAWMARRLGRSPQRRVSGPDVMADYCESASRTGRPLFLYGSTPATLERLSVELPSRWPGLNIVGTLSPPFRPQTDTELQADLKHIEATGAAVVLVGLGCPKQELWMHRVRGRLPAVMLGVGAAFDFHAGVVARAPRWMQHIGLEWLHRLYSDPKRLWRRYLIVNARFVGAAARQLVTGIPPNRRLP